MDVKEKLVRESRTVKSSFVLPPDTNNHGTLFGGKLMAYIDDVAAISAIRHARCNVVTASTDSVDFLYPISVGQSVCLESFVTWTHKTSMEVFVKITSENLFTGERKICAVSFLTFVALGADGKPTPVPRVVPETEEEKWLHNGAEERSESRRKRRENSKKLVEEFGTQKPWE
ncbi:thioester hydrolase [Fictibacillus macauensis ZFHKF-1]|uniref:Thioester hydrolase n=1 Tax=Fictibacillus macauensis ZFHKF-1 TaxID=1196324 RepID=I8J3G4_9BACL|nr:acyl-CoA thioesterase [Fictibacillus macauensis]EIT86316.1 thioester hydrolase [Fictibacillus macauensis ZFHKF-1]